METGYLDDILKVVTQKVTLQRKVQNKTQQTVANEAKVSAATVHLFEKDSTNISLKNLAKIAGAVGLRVVIDVVPIEQEEPVQAQATS